MRKCALAAGLLGRIRWRNVQRCLDEVRLCVAGKMDAVEHTFPGW
jgi:hypothetical protein